MLEFCDVSSSSSFFTSINPLLVLFSFLITRGGVCRLESWLHDDRGVGGESSSSLIGWTHFFTSMCSCWLVDVGGMFVVGLDTKEVSRIRLRLTWVWAAVVVTIWGSDLITGGSKDDSVGFCSMMLLVLEGADTVMLVEVVGGGDWVLAHAVFWSSFFSNTFCESSPLLVKLWWVLNVVKKVVFKLWIIVNCSSSQPNQSIFKLFHLVQKA